MKKPDTNTGNKDRSIFILTIFLLIISLVCLVINYSIDRAITWALYPIGGLIVAWATITPILGLKKYKIPGMLIGLSCTLIPYLFLIQQLVSVKGWFIPLALPISILSLIALAISLYALAHKKINKFYAVALTVLLFGVLINIGVAILVYRFLEEDIVFDIYRISTISVAVILALILMIIGYYKAMRD